MILFTLTITDKDLAAFYRELMISEATHYTVFLGFARKYANGHDVEARWQEFLAYEAQLMDKYSKTGTIHG